MILEFGEYVKRHKYNNMSFREPVWFHQSLRSMFSFTRAQMEFG